MVSQPNPGNKGTRQTGYGKHADRRTKRLRTRAAQDDFWKTMELGEAYADFSCDECEEEDDE